MADPAPTNNDPSGGAGNGDPNGNGGGDPNANPNPAPSNGGDGNLDLSKLSGEQLAKVLENPELWKQPRIAELLESNKELKNLKEQKSKDDQKALEEQGKFKELADSRATEIEQLKEKIQNQNIDQALTTKLVPEGVVDIEAALKLVDRSKIQVDDNGNITGMDEVITALKTDKSYLFGQPGQPSVGGPTNPSNQPSGPAKFKRSQLQDNAFYQEHRKEILEAQKAGLIEDDLTPANHQR